LAGEVESFFGIISLVIVAVVMLIFISAIYSFNSDNVCAPYKSQISTKDTIISNLNSENNILNENLTQCKNDYNYLVENEVTKNDIGLIRSDINYLHNQVFYLNQNFETITENQFSFQQNIVNNFNFSFVLNVVFALELLSFIFWKQEFILKLYKKIKNRKKNDEEKVVKS
jgi:hypothetical protein